MPFSATHPTSLLCRLRRKASPFMSCYCQVSFALLIRHVFQVLIITVFMLITSAAPSAKFHTHKHQLPSLFFLKRSHNSVTGALRSAGLGRAGAGTEPAWCNPGPERPQDPWGCPRIHGDVPKGSARSSLLCPAAGLAGSALRGHTGTRRDSSRLPCRDVPTDT